MTEIKAIETVYKGYRFRSRLEARWAVFFDTIGAHWEYEPEGFQLPNGEWYLPDFYSRDFGGGGYFEVKPDTEIRPEWVYRVSQVAHSKKEDGYILNGPPDFKFYKGTVLMRDPDRFGSDNAFDDDDVDGPPYYSVLFCGGHGPGYAYKIGSTMPDRRRNITIETYAREYQDEIGFMIKHFGVGRLPKDPVIGLFWDKYVEAVYASRAARF